MCLPAVLSGAELLAGQRRPNGRSEVRVCWTDGGFSGAYVPLMSSAWCGAHSQHVKRSGHVCMQPSTV